MAQLSVRPADLPGVWARTLLRPVTGPADTTTWVRWVQGLTMYGDLRVPDGRPDFGGARALDDLKPDQLRWLATQEGFAGVLERDGGAYRWRRWIDLQPPAALPDAGWLTIVPDRALNHDETRLLPPGPRTSELLIEHGRHEPYLEHWRRAEYGVPVAAVRLSGPDGRPGVLVRAGAAFCYARGRRVQLRGGPSLAHRVGAACAVGHLGAARELVDCEISVGQVDERGWLVTRSSLPYREGLRLDPVLETDTLVLRGEAYRWHVTTLEGDRSVLSGRSSIDVHQRSHG